LKILKAVLQFLVFFLCQQLNHTGTAKIRKSELEMIAGDMITGVVIVIIINKFIFIFQPFF